MDPARSTFRIGTLGPKDWIPGAPESNGVANGDFLSKEDRARFDKIKDSRKGGGQVPSGEVEWLVKTVETMSTLRRIDDFIFPDYISLYNPIAKVAYAMRFDGRMDHLRTRRTVVATAGPTDIMNIDLACLASDAFHVVRPVIEILKSDPEDLGKLLDGTLVMSVDGRVVFKEPLRYHAAPLDRKAPFMFRGTYEDLFSAHPLVRNFGTGIFETAIDRTLGLFLPNASHVVLTVMHGDHVNRAPVLVKAWLLGALYTTRQAGQQVL